MDRGTRKAGSAEFCAYNALNVRKGASRVLDVDLKRLLTNWKQELIQILSEESPAHKTTGVFGGVVEEHRSH